MHIHVRVSEAGDAATREELIHARVRELLQIGATFVREEYYEPQYLGHIVMLDPEGNEFCVA